MLASSLGDAWVVMRALALGDAWGVVRAPSPGYHPYRVQPWAGDHGALQAPVHRPLQGGWTRREGGVSIVGGCAPRPGGAHGLQPGPRLGCRPAAGPGPTHASPRRIEHPNGRITTTHRTRQRTHHHDASNTPTHASPRRIEHPNGRITTTHRTPRPRKGTRRRPGGAMAGKRSSRAAQRPRGSNSSTRIHFGNISYLYICRSCKHNRHYTQHR